jgi:hypothetical protein
LLTYFKPNKAHLKCRLTMNRGFQFLNAHLKLIQGNRSWKIALFMIYASS